ncbi:MAG: platelet-activating factor acetylhydrolase, plasma/intracellular isoform [Clostridia bacterium]|jgi:dienelactone hydrolase|nr:platelet-activating factor acetylhydrolase, plasma/intracellular isoform [Clostridia bacterium]
MLTILEILIILANIPVLVWALLPVKKVPRFLDFMPLASVVFLILHLFIDNEPVRLRFIPIYIFTITTFLVTIVRIFHHNPDQPKRRVLAGVGRIFALLMLIIAVLVPTVVIPFYSLPEPTGKFNVGTVVSDFTDNNRIETLSKEKGENRKIAVQFWYPSDKTGDKFEYDINGAPISTSQQKYPVLIFSHGAFGVRMSNASTFRELASHGYIVASIDHTYQAFYTSFADGKSAPISMEFLNNAMKVQTDSLPIDETFKITHEWLDLRTADINLVIDSLKAGDLGAAGTMLNGHMDLANIGLFGHSLGGAASAQISRERDDVKAAIVIDGTMIGDITGVNSNNKETITDKSFTKPLLLMYGSLFNEPEAKETAYLPNINAFNNATDAAYSLCIKDSGHLNFTDLPRISPLLSGMLGVGTVDSLECIKIVNAYSLAFFDEHLKGKSSSLLDGEAMYKEAEFQKRIPVGMGN